MGRSGVAFTRCQANLSGSPPEIVCGRCPRSPTGRTGLSANRRDAGVARRHGGRVVGPSDPRLSHPSVSRGATRHSVRPSDAHGHVVEVIAPLPHNRDRSARGSACDSQRVQRGFLFVNGGRLARRARSPRVPVSTGRGVARYEQHAAVVGRRLELERADVRRASRRAGSRVDRCMARRRARASSGRRMPG